MTFDDLVAKTVVIWGAGREGRAAHAELARRGVESTIAITGTDTVPADLADNAIVGSAALAALERADVVVKSPGVPRSSDEFTSVVDSGATITSLTALWMCDQARRAIGVTGTKGKSTTSALIQHVLRGASVSAELIGNGGTPVTSGGESDAEVAVVEISSYQAAELTTSPRVVVVTSIFPEHLPWHGSFERYVADKLNLVAHGSDAVVVPELVGDVADRVRAVADPNSLVAPSSIGIDVTDDGIAWEGIGELPAAEFSLRGRHNLVNLALALTAADAFAEFDPEGRAALLRSARTFTPLAHRLEVVPSIDDRVWVDDTLATAPEAVIAALDTYPAARITLVFGGADRGLDYTNLLDYLKKRDTVDVIATGPAGERLAAEAAVTARFAGSFAAAMELVVSEPSASDVVMLSPGAPSFDEFASFEERSAAFRAAAAGEDC